VSTASSLSLQAVLSYANLIQSGSLPRGDLSALSAADAGFSSWGCNPTVPDHPIKRPAHVTLPKSIQIHPQAFSLRFFVRLEISLECDIGTQTLVSNRSIEVVRCSLIKG